MEDIKFVYDENDYVNGVFAGEKFRAYRIIANRDIYTQFGLVKKGSKGGYIVKGTLSQEGDCWVSQGSSIGPDCFVSGAAYVNKSTLGHDVFVGNSAVISCSKIFPKTKVTAMGASTIKGSKIFGGAYLSGDASLEYCCIRGEVSMTDDSYMRGCEVEKGSHLSFVNHICESNKTISGQGLYSVNPSIKTTEKTKGL